VISQLLVVARQAEDIPDAQGRRTEDVALERKAISVAQRQLQDGFGAGLLQQNASSQARHTNHGDLVVGDVDGVTRTFEEVALFQDDFGLATPWRPGLGGHGELPTFENAFQLAA
jgi:hypothetical protein